MTNKKIQFSSILLIVLIIVVLALFTNDVFHPFEKKASISAVPQALAMDFYHSLAKGTIIADGTYAIYSLGSEVDPLSLGLPETADVHYVEFPLTTSDGKVVNGSFFIFGKILDQNTVNDVFNLDGKSRNILTRYIPAFVRTKMLDGVAKFPYSAFADDQSAARLQIKQDIITGLNPVFEDLYLHPIIITVLINGH